MQELTINPEFQALIPPLSADEYAQLEANVIADGCREPICAWLGTIIDGHNRYKICTEHGIEFDVREMDFDDDEAVKVWMIDNQNGRRNLTDGWKFELAQAKKALLAEKGAEKRAATQGRPSNDKPLSNVDNSKHDTRKEVAADLGWSTGKVAMADKVWREADADTKEKVKSGEVSINQAYQQVKRESRRKDIEQRIEEVKSRPKTATISGPYDIVLADPPWRYDFSETKGREIENQYPTATVDEICSHDPEAAENCILFLWATAPKLIEALKVMEAWGFSYKTQAVWDKEKIGMGYWFRGQHEIFLVGTKGKVQPPPDVFRVSSVFRETRSKHSKKPICVYEWIERAFFDKKKLEMYCRDPRDGWGVWGNMV